MKTLMMTTVIVMSLMKVGQAETYVTVEPMNYAKLQHEIRWSAERARKEAVKGRVQIGNLEVALGRTIDAVASLAMQLPYESFDSVEGNRLMRQLVRLSALRDEVKTGLSGELLERIEAVCEEIAE